MPTVSADVVSVPTPEALSVAEPITVEPSRN